MNDNTGARLREARIAAGVTQQRLADYLNKDRGTVIRWEGRALVPVESFSRAMRAIQELAERPAA